MAAPYVASKGTASAVTTGASTPTYPASVAANDIIFLLAISHQPVSIGVINTPTDFTEVAQGTYANSGSTNQGRVALFWRRASGSLTGTVSVTRTGDTGTDGTFYTQMYRVVGAVTSGTPWDAATTDYGPGNATVDIPSVTVSGAERTLLAFIAQADNASTVDPPSGYVALATDTTATGTDAELRICHRRNIDTTIGGGATTTTGGETEGWGVFHLSMIPQSTYSAPSIVLTGDALRMDGAQDVMRLDYADSTGLLYCTITCWAKMSVDRNNYSTIFAIEDGAGHSTKYNELITDADGVTLSVYDDVTGDIADVQTMTVGTWYAIGFKITSGAWKSYIGTEGFTSLTTATGSLTNILFNDLFGVGSTTFTATETFNGLFSQFRVWSGALTDDEIKAELQSSRPVRINDLVGSWFPLGVAAGTETTATYGNAIVSRGVGTPDWTFAAGPLMTLLTSGAVTEGSETSSGVGVVGDAAVTSSGAITEAAEVSAGAGVVVIVGSGAVTEEAEVSAGAGALVPVGSGALTEAAEVSAGVGTVVVLSSGAITEAAETSSGTAYLVVAGSGAITEAAEVAAGSGIAAPSGSGAVTEAAEVAAGVGVVVIVGSGANTEDTETSSGSGVVGDAAVTSSGAITEAAESIAGAGVVVIVGSGALTEAAETSSGTGYLVVAGSGAIAEASEVSVGAGALVPVGSGIVTEAAETTSGAALVVVVSLGSSTEGNETSSGSGVVGDAAVTCSGAITEAAESVAGAGIVVIVGTGAITEATEVSASMVAVASTCSGAITEASEVSAGVLSVGSATYHYYAPGNLFDVVSVVQKPITCSIVQEDVTVTVF